MKPLSMLVSMQLALQLRKHRTYMFSYTDILLYNVIHLRYSETQLVWRMLQEVTMADLIFGLSILSLNNNSLCYYNLQRRPSHWFLNYEK